MAKKDEQAPVQETPVAAAAAELTAEEKLAAAEKRIAEAEAKAAEAEAKAAEAEAKAKTAEAAASSANSETASSGTLPKIIKTSDPKEADKYHKQGFVVRKSGSGRNAVYVVHTTKQVLPDVTYVQQEVDSRLKGIGSKG